MSIAVLLSIKPQFANAIFSGEKRYEFRKAIFKDARVSKVFVYASAPVSRVIGVFYLDGIIANVPSMLWEITNSGAGITKEYFEDYFSGRDVGYALGVKEASLFDEPQKLYDMFDIRHPPQSFRYVPQDSDLTYSYTEPAIL